MFNVESMVENNIIYFKEKVDFFQNYNIIHYYF